jgi:hypothetical protein
MPISTVCGAYPEPTNSPNSGKVADHLTECIIDEYVLYRLNGAEVDLVEEHLLSCHVCLQETEQTLLMIEMLRLHSIGVSSASTVLVFPR